MTEEEFEKIKQVAAIDTTIPEDELPRIEYSFTLSKRINKWCNILQKQTNLIKNLECDIADLTYHLLPKYKFNDSMVWSTAKEIEMRINGDPKFIELIRNKNIQESYQCYFKDTMLTLKSNVSLLKSYIDYKKQIMY
jgi:hypothetical protein